MDDRLQRRLRDADPLAAGDGALPDPERLDAIKEQIMQTEARPVRAALRPRAIGLVGVAAASLAVVLVAGSLLRPSAAALAWDPAPTAVTEAQKAAAKDACTAGLPTAVTEQGAGTVPVAPPSGLPVLAGGGTTSAVGGSGGTTDSGPVTVGTGDGGAPAVPPIPSALPPLVGLELHGTGGVAIFADAKTTAYCLLIKDGGTLVMGGLMFPDLGNGASAGVGTIGSAAGDGTSMGMVATGDNGFVVSAMSMGYHGTTLGIVAGTAPAGATAVKVVGGAADGATATVADGRFAMWAPGNLLGSGGKVEALDGSGSVVASQDLAAPAPPDAVTATTAP